MRNVKKMQLKVVEEYLCQNDDSENVFTVAFQNVAIVR